MDMENIFFRKIIHGFCRLLAKVYKRRFFRGLKPYGGSQWWMITFASAKFIVDFVKKNPRIIKFFKRTILSDEMFFQTLVLNSPNASNVINNNYRLIIWPESGPHPYIFTKEDFDLIKESNKLFARKFDSIVNKEIFDLIDQNILKT